jgi:hypothetical protein
MTISYKNPRLNQISDEDRAFHDWYRFVLSFPPHLVTQYLNRFGVDDYSVILDPFSGTGTTLVECKKQGVSSVGIEANPVAHFASNVKLDWSADPDTLVAHANKVAELASSRLHTKGIVDGFHLNSDSIALLLKDKHLLRLSASEEDLLLANSISPLPLHKILVLRDAIGALGEPKLASYERLALAKLAVYEFSNLHFGPEVGIGRPKLDVEVIGPWLEQVHQMAADIRNYQRLSTTMARSHLGDSRDLTHYLSQGEIQVVFTSPPYPNEKDYTRTTRLESVLLEFIKTKQDLRQLKQGLLRSNTRNVYVGDSDDSWVEHLPRVQDLANNIEARRIEMGKTSGFERLYARVTRLYFGGMARHLSNLRPHLAEGAWLGYVVGDQASYLRIKINTGEILAEIAEQLGYRVEGIDLFRTRIATATREQLREEVVVLRWK